MTFSAFRFWLAEQMMEYAPIDNHYSGDDKFREESSKAHKKWHLSAEDESRADSFPDTGVALNNLTAAWVKGWFCYTIEDVQSHFATLWSSNNKDICEVCGWLRTYWECKKCMKCMVFWWVVLLYPSQGGILWVVIVRLERSAGEY